MGRHKKPTVIKIAEGNPGKRPLNKREPQPDGFAECPDWITGPSRDCWEYIVDVLTSVPGLLTRADSASLALMADTLAMYRIAQAEMEAKGLTAVSEKGAEYQHPAVGIRNKAAEQLKQWFAKFGMTPADRANISLPESIDKGGELGEMLA